MMKALWSANTATKGGIRAAMCIVLAVLALGCALPAWAGPSTYAIAVIPSSPPVALHAQWAPFLERLARETGQQYRLKLFERMAEFEREIGTGSSDFILASPIQTVVGHQMNGYVPLVRGGKLVSLGVFVRKDSSFRSIDDLAGKTVSFVGNKNLCSVMVKQLLGKSSREFSYISQYAGSTRNVIKTVLLGKSAAGAVFISELDREPVENRQQLRCLAETEKIAPHPLSAHPRVPQAVRDAVKKAILNMAASREGADLLRTIRLPDPVAATYARDYQPLEIIDIKGLTDWGN